MSKTGRSLTSRRCVTLRRLSVSPARTRVSQRYPARPGPGLRGCRSRAGSMSPRSPSRRGGGRAGGHPEASDQRRGESLEEAGRLLFLDRDAVCRRCSERRAQRPAGPPLPAEPQAPTATIASEPAATAARPRRPAALPHIAARMPTSTGCYAQSGPGRPAGSLSHLSASGS